MKFKTLTFAATIAVLATTAVAHKGAKGMLLERMNGMLAMGKATKAIAPMMRGLEDYDADRTSDYAAILQTHSGDPMLALFPDGMNAAPSVAKDAIWTNWKEFSALAVQLETYATALDLAAQNGLGNAAPANSSMMGGDMTGMMGADMIGMMGGTGVDEKTLETLAGLSVNTLFVQSVQVCSACHTKFRAEE
ncbi:MAG: cytochrome c [Yoonia sp.]|nr:cytochrome c [Yoonia sp.]